MVSLYAATTTTKLVFREFLLGGSLGIVGVKLEESVKKYRNDPLRRVFFLPCAQLTSPCGIKRNKIRNTGRM